MEDGGGRATSGVQWKRHVADALSPRVGYQAFGSGMGRIKSDLSSSNAKKRGNALVRWQPTSIPFSPLYKGN